MTKLSVNLNAVAYLRNRRDIPWSGETVVFIVFILQIFMQYDT